MPAEHLLLARVAGESARSVAGGGSRAPDRVLADSFQAPRARARQRSLARLGVALHRASHEHGYRRSTVVRRAGELPAASSTGSRSVAAAQRRRADSCLLYTS